MERKNAQLVLGKRGEGEEKRKETWRNGGAVSGMWRQCGHPPNWGRSGAEMHYWALKFSPGHLFTP